MTHIFISAWSKPTNILAPMNEPFFPVVQDGVVIVEADVGALVVHNESR
jgi:hypothetical protein